MPEREQVFVDLERMIYAASGLLEDVIEPMFGCRKLDGVLEDIIKAEGRKSREDAALSWMEDNFESLESTIFAVRAIVEVLEP